MIGIAKDKIETFFGGGAITNKYPPLCVACKYKRIFGVLEVLKTKQMDPDILACKYVRIYLHAIMRPAITRFSKC